MSDIPHDFKLKAGDWFITCADSSGKQFHQKAELLYETPLNEIIDSSLRVIKILQVR